jgi:hypothetical protein
LCIHTKPQCTVRKSTILTDLITCCTFAFEINSHYSSKFSHCFRQLLCFICCITVLCVMK